MLVSALGLFGMQIIDVQRQEYFQRSFCYILMFGAAVMYAH